MRPETFKNKVNNAISCYLRTNSVCKLKFLLPEMEKRWNQWAAEEGDYRCGNESYGYHSIESVRSNMFYISDRWGCSFRIKWLIDGINNDKF